MPQHDDMAEFHWMMDMVQTVDVGIVVLNQNFEVKVWNAFMESHSGLLPSHVQNRSLFELFPDINSQWLRRKTRPVFELGTRAFMTWEQRPFLFRFPNYRPITGCEDFMYQNITISPLSSATGQVTTICMMIYDVTDVAENKKSYEALQVTLNALEEKLKP
ncbi:PAS domain-containing protein [Aliiglaciecola sp. 3_MG-2023]|uniref:PAS domain-containing protein n=1 Tax=Aliiglaciecola sp. 3_MG-2023 TaxID=3062644 RepID=UPI0026E18859|nr:PAS domain-containing protein [Aliiglaciecola sp. 3_MG-2023]MDO6691969.1 PAS domain-containing protein [Aliiglaciecola sp. 3_MG-2023]